MDPARELPTLPLACVCHDRSYEEIESSKKGPAVLTDSKLHFAEKTRPPKALAAVEKGKKTAWRF